MLAIRAAAGLLALALVAGAAQLARAQAVVDTGRADVRVALIGDFGTGSGGEAAVADLVHGLAPDLVATLGDDNYTVGAAATIDAHIGRYYADFIAPYRGRYGPGAAENRFFPALGNHDWATSGAAPYLAYFDLPGNERYYTVLAGSVELFVVDSDLHEPDGIDRASIQAQWLRAALAASTAPYRLVLFHHPAFSSGQHGANPALQWPFREWGASAVFCGHDHDYERIDSAGMPYVVAGTGGARLHGFGPPVADSQVRLATRYGALLVEADATHATASFVTGDGQVADQFELPPAGALAPGSPLVAEGSTWQYLTGGVVPPADWNALGFDASAWLSGPAPLGSGEGGEATVIQAGTTQYFVHRFDVASPGDVGWLELGLLADDSEVAYLNGVEVARTGFAPGKRVPPSAKGSKRSEPIAEPAVLHEPVDPALLVPGANVLAVELHPEKAKRVESSFNASLVGFATPVALVARGATWSYSDDGGAPDPDWAQPAYDAAAWISAPAPPPLRAPGDRPLAPHLATSFLRTEFAAADASQVRQLLLRAPRGEGARVYLNGVEVLRWDLPRGAVAAGAPGSATALEAAGPDLVETPISTLPLTTGRNVLAIELHPPGARSPGNFDLELVGLRR